MESCKTLGETFVFHDEVGGDFFTERLSSHGKVRGKHGYNASFFECAICN